MEDFQADHSAIRARGRQSGRAALTVLGLLAALSIGFGGGVLVDRMLLAGGSERPGQDPVQPMIAGAPVEDRSDQADQYPFQQVRAENAPRAATQTPEPEGFAYRRLVLDTGDLEPRACLQFSRDLTTDGSVNYGDYIRLTPSVRPAISVNGQSLCLGGLGFDTEYSAELRAGLPAASGETLERSETVTIAFGDKPAYVGFAGTGVILPRREADGFGIETVNVEAVNVEIFRVSDRALFQKSVTAGEAGGESDYFYVYGNEDGSRSGEKVFDTTLAIKSGTNETKTTVFPLGSVLTELSAGAYYVTLTDASSGTDDGQRRKAQAYRWISYTDLALTSYRGGHGLDVFVRSLKTAQPVSGTDIVLIARTNDVLASARTDREGRVRFDQALLRGEGNLAPQLIMAYGAQEDFAVLDLTRTPLDLSEFPVGGLVMPPTVDGYVYLDRGIYRPGERVHLSGLLRDETGRAVTDRPVTLEIRRPNGTLADERRIEMLEPGGFTLDYDVPTSAARGLWRATLRADGAGQVGAVSFSVEDFVPQRLEVSLEIDETTPMAAGETRIAQLDSRFLYGAPASDLTVEAEVRFEPDPNPFPAHTGYRFGPANALINQRFETLPKTRTDAEGRASLTIQSADAPDGMGRPLRAQLVAGVVEPGGRIVRESARIPVRPDKAYVGVRLADGQRSVSRKEPARLEAILLDRDGSEQAGELEWRLVREDSWFDWYRENGDWKWRRSYRDILIDEGRTSTDGSAPAEITRQLEQGSYRIAVWQPGSRTKSEQPFYVGWRSYGSGRETPDQAVVSFEGKNVEAGQPMRVFLDPPYAGEATIMIATDRIHRVETMPVSAGGTEIMIETDPDWGTGFYVLASIVTPRDAVDQPIPRRAMGLAHVPFDLGARTLDVAFDMPEVVRPRQKIAVPVKIAGAAGPVQLTLAAVDEGILRLTKFESPNPVDYFYGKKRLGLTVHDDYGRILNANLGAAMRVGGDQIGGEGLTVVPTKSVALFSGIVNLDETGAAEIAVNVPDFNGELRLMAVAWSADGLGQTAQPLTVRDPVPAELSLSRFLAPGDEATATLLIDNVDGASGTYTVSLSGVAPVILDETIELVLAEGEKTVREIPFKAGAEGVGAVALSVAGPGGFAVARDYPIEVRSPWYPVTETRTITQAPGETFQLTDALLDGYIPGSGSVALSYSRLKGIEPGPLLDALYRYPYGCTEQLTSSSFPLLYVDTLGGEVGRAPDRAVRPRVQTAINKMLDRQSPDGSIGLWRVGDRYANAWLGPYVTDFLFRARAEGYAVPENALDLAYSALNQIANVDQYTNVGYITRISTNDNTDSTKALRYRAGAYAHYVLARAGRGDLSDIRYFHDSLLSQTQNPLAKAHIGAALALYGDRARAENAFNAALTALGYQNRGNYYQTPLRDAAGIVALIAEAGFDHLIDAATDGLVARTKDPKAMHTQEKAFVLMAANALLKSAGPVALSMDGQALSGLPAAPMFTPGQTAIEAGRTYTNNSDAPLYLSITRTGTPTSAPPGVSEGVRWTKRILMRDGAAADLGAARQNDRFVIVLSGLATDKRTHPFIIADLLPAGFEIETILQGSDPAYPWLSDLSFARIAEARDDRFVAAVEVRGGKRFTLAYIVRAVTPGRYAMPGAVVEDMYRPGVFARTLPGRLTIASAQ